MKILCILLGVASWTLAEYLLHRFLGHVHKGKNFFKAEHFQHHAIANYFAPAWKKGILALFVSAGMTILLSLFIAPVLAISFMAGFTGMYILYERTHFRYHSKEPLAAPFVELRKHHFYHHFHNPLVNHGVTTRIWDRVFGTFVKVYTVKVPKSMKMEWLLSEEDELKPEYTGHFLLAKR